MVDEIVKCDIIYINRTMEGDELMCKLVSMTANGKEIKVADIKKDYIQNIIDAAQLCPRIDKIMLFGSALEERCTEHSDIDIAVFGKLPRGRMYALKGYQKFISSLFKYTVPNKDFQDYDILYFNSNKLTECHILGDILNGEVLFSKEVEQ